MFFPLVFHPLMDECLVSNWNAEDNRSLLMFGAFPHPCTWIDLVDPRRLASSSVPDFSFSQVDHDTSMLFQGFRNDSEDILDPVWITQNIDVVEIGEQQLILFQSCTDVLQCQVLSQRIQSRHERIALLSSFSVLDDVRIAIIVVPQVLEFLP